LAQQEAVGASIRRDPHSARGKTVDGVGLVGRARHQRRERELHSLRAVALEDVAVERIEGEEGLIVLPLGADLGKYAALRRARIDVVEMDEIRRLFEIAER